MGLAAVKGRKQKCEPAPENGLVIQAQLKPGALSIRRNGDFPLKMGVFAGFGACGPPQPSSGIGAAASMRGSGDRA